MELLQVRLRNIRSFADVTIDVGRGVVRIAGENGAGKSTIVAGIAYAFLGAESVESRRYVVNLPESLTGETKHIELDHSSKLLRRGEAWGLVSVTFKTSREPDKVFRVHRVLGKRPKPRGRTPSGAGGGERDPIDTEDAALVLLGADGASAAVLETKKSAIAGAVGKLLDLPEESFVHAFKRIVAAPQGRLLQAIFEDAKDRRDIYWKVLGVDRYARAFADATRMGGLLEDRYLRRVEHAVAAADQEVKDLAGAPELAARLEVEAREQERLVLERRAAQGGAAKAREVAAESVAHARERASLARRLLVERSELQKERDAAGKALAEAERAATQLQAIAPEVARFEALQAERGAREKALAAFEAARTALEQARRRESELLARDREDQRKLARQLDDARKAEALAAKEQAEVTSQLALADRELAALGPEAKKASDRREALARWSERFRQPLARLLENLARPAFTPEALEVLAASAPEPERAEDLELASRASVVGDEVARLAGAVGESRARVETSEDLARRVGEGSVCPFLAVACPHPKGTNLLATVVETTAAQRRALEAAEKALADSQDLQRRVRAAEKRLEQGRSARQAWSARAVQAGAGGASWVDSWDRERSELARSAALAPFGARDLVQGLSLPEASAARPIGQVRLFDSVPELGRGLAPAPQAFAPPPEWTPDALRSLARVLRARRVELEAALPRSLSERLASSEEAATHEASELETRLQAASRRVEKLKGQLEKLPARLAELGASLARLGDEQVALAARHAADAVARSTEVAAAQGALRALEHVPSGHALYTQALEAASRADQEARRLRGVAEGAASARERVESVRVRSTDLSQRALALGASSPDALIPGVLEQLGAMLAASLLATETALAAARAAEEKAAALLLEGETRLTLLRHQHAEAAKRAALLGAKRDRLEKLRQARDHVAHACSVLRGGSGAGPLAGALYRALSELPGRLAERRVREVAGHARRLYRAIAPQETWDLMWDPRTYVLALGAPGMSAAQAVREGIAIDDMSGGQQMSAALALHLALVHTYARNCDVLFLDEPTTHLDAKRRRALAECLRSLRSRVEGLVPLRQVFLISHDDAFEGLQDQVIRVLSGANGAPSTIEGPPVSLPGAATPVPVAPAEIHSPPVARTRPRRKAKEAPTESKGAAG